MLLLNQPDTPDNALSSTGNIDTSHIYLSLKDKYQSNTEKALEVDFRSLLPWVKLGDQFTHLIHPYPAKLIPHIANFFINASVLAKKGDIVLDPFSGSGTVALEASLAGRTPHISDANPLALLISKVKTFNYNIDELTNALMDISGKAKRYKVAPEINVVNSSVWYSEFIKKKLEIILRAIMQLENNDIRDFFRICFSVTARKLSNADPAISVPVKLKCKPNFSENRNNQILKRLNWLNSVSVIDEFTTISLLNINRVRNANEFNKNRISAKITSHNVNDLSDHYDSNEKPSLIITSPPYGSAQKYIRSSSLSLNWLGFTEPENLIKLEDISIGREHAPFYRKKNYNDKLPDKFLMFLDEIKLLNVARYEITRQYLYEMKIALYEIAKTIKPGGHIVIITGNNSVCGKVLENDSFINIILSNLGLKLELHLFDNIKSRGLMTKRNKTASIINRESVMVFLKEATNE